jgi:hypothetical protein
MKRKFILIIIFTFFGLSNKAQTNFQKIFGGIGQDGGYSVIQTSDSGYVFTGNWCYGGGGGNPCNDCMFLIKTNQTGNALWTKLFHGTGALYSAGESVIKTNTNDFVAAGYTTLDSYNRAQFYLVKTDLNGDSLWTKLYGDENSGSYAYSVKQTIDNGFIMAGYTSDGTNSLPELIKTNSNGDSLWAKTYAFGSNRPAIAHSVLEINGGYIILGYVLEPNTSGNNDIFLIKTNSMGDTLWTKVFPGNNDDQGFSLKKTQDNGFIISGATLSYGAGSYDAYLIKTDSNGVTQWTKTFGGFDNEYANHVSTTTDGGFIIAGSTESFSVGSFDAYLIKTDSLGNQQWYKTFGGVNADYAYSVQQTYDGGYILVGLRGDNIYLIKTDDNGNVASTNEIDMTSLIYKINIYPNPFSIETTLRANDKLKEATLTICNTLGQEVKIIKNISGQEYQFNRDNLPNGIYFLRLTQDNKVIANDKLVITQK